MCANDSGNRRSRYAELPCKSGTILTCGVQSPYGDHIRSSEPRESLMLTSSIPSLLHHVGHVVCAGAEKEVVRSDASAIVTLMTDKEPFWDPTEVNLPRVTMDSDLPTLDPEVPISMGGESSGPEPAAVRLLDIDPESLLRGRLSLWHGTSLHVAEPGDVHASARIFCLCDCIAERNGMCR